MQSSISSPSSKANEQAHRFTHHVVEMQRESGEGAQLWPDPDGAKRALNAMLQMTKINLEDLRIAYEGA